MATPGPETPPTVSHYAALNIMSDNVMKFLNTLKLT